MAAQPSHLSLGPTDSSPGTFIHLKAASCCSQAHNPHVFLRLQGAGRPFAKQRGGIHTRAEEGMENSAFPPLILIQQGQQR